MPIQAYTTRGLCWRRLCHAFKTPGISFRVVPPSPPSRRACGGRGSEQEDAERAARAGCVGGWEQHRVYALALRAQSFGVHAHWSNAPTTPPGY
ncbi:hypothetical protein C8J57DRAFT_1500888 [Mycena rebaudengoi]|nr:hypothetical protein C8J57DRAFT_1500888 [Mycena rebaudengoi]